MGVSGGLEVLFYLMAFCSGAAALVYEVTWARMLGLTFGSTMLSAAAVIASFMGGMGLGAWLYHLLLDRVSRPLLIYAALETGIALTTALLTRTFYHLPGLFADISQVVPSGPGLTVVRLLGVFVLLVLPAALMGATFPALCTVLIRTVRGVDRHLGMIYGINTIGAATGALLAGLVLIERLGLTGTVTVANVLNLAVGLGALAFLRTSLGRGDVRGAPPSQSAIPTCLPRRVTGIVLFTSGLATLSYEVLWFRALRFTVGNSTYALTIVLIIFLVGLGLGSLLLERITRRRAPERDLALCQYTIAVLAVAAVACLWLVESVPALYEHVSIRCRAVRDQPWMQRLFFDGTLATLTMMPATLFMGVSFPLASRLFLGDVRKLDTRVGAAYLLANLGSILGALLAAILLLPLLGTIGGTKLVAGLNLALGFVVLLRIRGEATGWRRPTLVAIALVGFAAITLPASLGQVGDVSQRGDDTVVIYSRDDDLGTVQVLEDPNDATRRYMTIDGCAIGFGRGYQSTRTYRKQIVLAHLPMLLDTRIRHTLNVGLGSGGTLHALASYPDLQTLDCVEISPAVVDAARLFSEGAVFDDPRVTVVVDDGVHFLLRAGRDYDLIISDGKQDPFFSGNAILLCREFYRNALAHLTEDGIFIQWFMLGMLDSEFAINLRTFCEVFPHVEVFWIRGSAYVVGSRRTLFDRPGVSDERFLTLQARADLAPLSLGNLSGLLAGWSSGKPQLEQVLGVGPISRWDHLLTDFSSYKATPKDWSRSWNSNTALLWTAEQVARPEGGSFELAEPIYRRSRTLLREAFAQKSFARARALTQQAIQVNPRDRAYAEAQLREFAGGS